MEPTELSAESYEDMCQGSGIVVIDCTADWCKYCERFRPVFEQAAERHPAHHFATLDTEAHGSLAAHLGIGMLPTVQVYRDGILLVQHPGSLSAEGIDDLINQAERLDMDVVRAAEGRLNQETAA